MANSNCLEDVQCPACSSEGPFNIVGTAWFFVTDDGTSEFRDVEWDDDSTCVCPCGKRGPLRDFKTGTSCDEGSEREPGPTKRERDVMDAMAQGGTYAQVWWTVEHILARANDLGIEMTTEKAESILSGAELDIDAAMARAGWDIIEEILLSGIKPAVN